MSSLYRLLCLNHDPAIEVADYETHSVNDALAAARDQPGELLAAHAACDLVVGCWSGGLVEIGCPRLGTTTSPHRWHPVAGYWVSRRWLRLLDAAHQAGDAGVAAAAADLDDARCWTPGRLARLRPHLTP